ncbi:hypothetical protein A2U01_0063785, partial [Trifolium medium]|nr:hypothetical protein [Trifolium medium]
HPDLGVLARRGVKLARRGSSLTLAHTRQDSLNVCFVSDLFRQLSLDLARREASGHELFWLFDAYLMMDVYNMS